MADRFPIMSTLVYDRLRRLDAQLPRVPASIPWRAIEPHRQQAYNNHAQTLERLAQRGGLSPGEAVAVMEDREWTSMDMDTAIERLIDLVAHA